jgi:hypothetical protein
VSIRYDVQTSLVTVLQAEITTGNGYTHDLSALGDITNFTESYDQRVSSMQGDVQIQIEEGREEHTMPEISPDTLREVAFEVILDCLIRGQATNDPTWRKRLNDLVADLNKGLHKDQTVGGVVLRARVARVDAPTYDPENSRANVLIRLLVEYIYTAGTTI